MTIYEQIKLALNGRINEIVSPSELKRSLQELYGTNPDSVILSDYCYNRYNNGINFNQHLFEYINRSSYKYLGENYLYTGLIFQKPKGLKSETIVGEWVNGVKSLKKCSTSETISKEQILNLYNEYNKILRYEMNILNCKPTELRHLIGRIGEFICAIETNGKLSRHTNQHGFDVISNGRRISVKTTAQNSGFITINKNTFKDFDDLFVIQYTNDVFNILFYGPKELVEKFSRTYEGKYEVDIIRLKKHNLYEGMFFSY
ncbi:DUF7225 domain-containing protein [Heyndrickxia oleronia]|uniref:Uncharacterized protein n=1 Tax=Heyndrickxia oleronia TaxID=38875 RepID=A0AAW6SXT0_9BACI|nr:hypothetical protein [Heyndrickxia oleronia]MDH5161742.1 hypothetical protein [Heyndrickxia oleronia]